MPASTTLTRGPLPPGTYWRRRVIALVLAFVLVYLIAHLLGAGSNGRGGQPVAQQAAAVISTSTTPTTAPTGTAPTLPLGPTYVATGRPTSSGTPLILAAPTGPCTPSDIDVTPSVTHAVAGTDVTITLSLQTTTEAACTWQVDRHDIAVKIARAGRTLWSSQQCPGALPARSVVVRNVVPSIVTMVWNSRFSTVGCRTGAPYVRPGKAYVYGTTLGGEPGHSAFTLVLPSTQTITATPTPTATARSTATATASGQPRR